MRPFPALSHSRQSCAPRTGVLECGDSSILLCRWVIFFQCSETPAHGEEGLESEPSCSAVLFFRQVLWAFAPWNNLGSGHKQRDGDVLCTVIFGLTVLKNKDTPAEFLWSLDSDTE